MAYYAAHHAYFDNQVLTATPQKLRWMAIDGAIRFARQAGEHWRQEKIYEGGEAVIGCQRLILELMSSLQPERAPELVGQVAGLYAYISRLLDDARRTRDLKKLGEVIEVLEIERETWRLVCEQLGSETPSPETSAAAHDAPHAPLEPSPPGHTPSLAPHGIGRFNYETPASGFTASA